MVCVFSVGYVRPCKTQGLVQLNDMTRSRSHTSFRNIVPARTVGGVRQATAAETSASGLQGPRSGGGGGGALVMEFTSELNARLAL